MKDIPLTEIAKDWKTWCDYEIIVGIDREEFDSMDLEDRLELLMEAVAD